MDNDNDNNTEYTINTSYTLIQVESDLRCTWLDTCIAGCVYASTDAIHYMFCCFCLCCYIEDDD